MMFIPEDINTHQVDGSQTLMTSYQADEIKIEIIDSYCVNKNICFKIGIRLLLSLLVIFIIFLIFVICIIYNKYNEWHNNS